MIHQCALLIIALAGASMVALADVPAHDFDDIAAWKDNGDGGNAPAISLDTEFTREGSGMRIRYTDSAPHWGNLTAACTVPPDARALRLWVYNHSASPDAVLHIWLFEPDGDGWLQRVRFDGKNLSELGPGWHEGRVAVSEFMFQPRGAKNRDMVSVDRMLIGCNYGDFDITMDSMTWETGVGGEALPLPKTVDLRVDRREYSFGILDMGDGLPQDFSTAHPPAELTAALSDLDFGATVLKPGDLANAEVLTRENFDAIILPFGPYFPAEAKDAFAAYLRAGGSFLSTDGYAFDMPVYLTDRGYSQSGAEVTASEMNQPGPEDSPNRINTRVGKPGDAMTLHPAQIGVFDPQFRLRHATEFRPAGRFANPLALAEGFAAEAARSRLPVYALDAPAEGFSACGLTGVNGAVFPPVYRRWIPVLEAFEAESGALRGTALSIMHNFTGEYPGSSWAFSGLTDGTDVFLGDDARKQLFRRVLLDIADKVYLHSLTTDLACYEAGESATISVQAVNHGRRAAQRRLFVEVGDGTPLERDITLQPGESQTIEVTVSIDDLRKHYDLVPVEAVLAQGERISDTFKTAFCIRNEDVLNSGPKFAWEDNYLTVDGRPTFMVGTNQTGMMFFSQNETPLVWDRDFAAMNRHNFHIMRILHFSPYSEGGYEGRPTNNPLGLANRPEKLVRQTDAIVQLAQKHRVAIFLTMHDWMGTALTDEELAVQADWNRFWAARYKNVPGVFYDVQNEPSVGAIDRPDILALWNQFLRDRYGDDEALRAAWDKNPPEAAMPDVPLGNTSDDWYDVRSADHKRFEATLLNRWVKANVDPVHEADPDTPICVGYLPSMPPADKILGVKHTDFSNMHYYGPPERMPIEAKIIDRRFQGKGFSLGEFGAQAPHDYRVNGSYGDGTSRAIYRFETFVHYAAGLGGAFIANWDWKEFEEAVFPWGLMHHCSNVAKPWTHTLGQGALLLSLAAPVYESPEVFVCAPDSNRVGPHFNEMHRALGRAVDLTLDQRVNFGTVNEEDIADLPPSAKALIWPVPYCPSDEAFAKILDWVKSGGVLYLSGDVSFDRTRKPTRAARLEQLGLPAMDAFSPFDTPAERWSAAPIETAVGEGKVLFAPYPLEIKGADQDDAIYRRVLEMADISPISLQPADAPVRVFSLPTAAGGHIYTLCRVTEGEDLLTVTLPLDGGAEATVSLADRGCVFVVTGEGGRVLALESDGPAALDGSQLATGDHHFGLASLDGQDLRRSQQILILPHRASEVGFSGVAMPDGASVCIGDSRSAFTGTVRLSPGAAGQVAVVAPANQMSEAVQRVTDLRELRF